MKYVKISLMSSMFSDFWYDAPPPTVEEQITMAANWGFDGIELVGDPEFGLFPLHFDKTTRKKLKEFIASKGLETPLYSPRVSLGKPDPVARLQELQVYKSCVDLAVDFDIKLVRWEGGFYSPDVPYYRVYNAAKEALRTCQRMAEDAGVTLAVDNHFFAPISENVRLIEELGNPSCLKMNIDCGNAGVMRDDYIGAVRSWGKLVVHTHLKDFRRLTPLTRIMNNYSIGVERNTWHYQTIERLEWVPIGEGEVDVKGFVAALKEGGYRGYLSVEDFSPKKNREASTRRGLAYLRKIS